MQIIAILIGVLLMMALAFYISRPLVGARRVVIVRDVASLEVQREAVYTQIRELDMDHATGKTNDEDYQRIRAELVAQAAAVLKKIDGIVQAPMVEPMPALAPALAMSDDDLEGLIAARRKVKPAAATVEPNGDHLEAAIAARRKMPPVGMQTDQDIEVAIAARRKSSPVVTKSDRDVEAAIAARRKAPPVVAKTDKDIEAMVAARRKGPPLVTQAEVSQDGTTGDKAVVPPVTPSINSARTCPKCGNPVAADDAFCAKCGAALACPKCGKPIQPGDVFCSKCGTALQSQAAS